MIPVGSDHVSVRQVPDPEDDGPVIGWFLGRNRFERRAAGVQFFGYALLTIDLIGYGHWSFSVDLWLYLTGAAVVCGATVVGWRWNFVGPTLFLAFLLLIVYVAALAVAFSPLVLLGYLGERSRGRRALEPPAGSPSLIVGGHPEPDNPGTRMGGVNPYIVKPQVKAASKPFRITFHVEETGEQKTFTADPTKFPYGHTGLEGSIMDIAAGADIEIDHSCGGVCACATCHVKVTQGEKSCSKATEDEEDMLDTARDVDMDSRLSCQCVPDGTEDLVVVIPKWNKNEVKEGH